MRADSVPSVLGAILEAAVKLHGADAGDIRLFDPASGKLSVGAHRGLSDEFVRRFESVSAEGIGMWSRALREGIPVLVGDITGDPRFEEQRPFVSAAGFRAVQIIPLINNAGDLLGVLSLYAHAPDALGAYQRASDLFVRQVTDLIERKGVEERLTTLAHNEQVARHAMDETVRMKDEFLAVLSHELRNPLSAILGWARVLQSKDLDADAVREGVEAVTSSAQALSRLVDDLLDVSRIAAGKFRLELVELDLAEVVTSAIEVIKPTAQAKGVAIHVKNENGSVGVLGDRQRLQQVLWNLLVNAVKFTPAVGQVTLSTHRNAGYAEIRVTDTGAGIDPQFLPFVFDRFRQYEGAKTRRQGGLGLGLAIAKQLVELHGGTVEATSAGLGKGSTFTVQLPIHFGARAPARTNEVGGEFKSLAGIRLLLVEDELISQRAMSLLLRQAGAEVIAVASAGEALEAYGTASPQLLISDIGLPDFDGYTLLNRIRERERAQKRAAVPAVALTAYARHQDRTKALAAGFQLHFAKPVNAQELIEALAGLRRRDGAGLVSGSTE